MEEKIAMFELAHIKLWTVIYQFQGDLVPGFSGHLNIANYPWLIVQNVIHVKQKKIEI